MHSHSPTLDVPTVRNIDTHSACCRIPDHWACVDGNIADFVHWYMEKIHWRMPARTMMARRQLEIEIASADTVRPLAIYVLAEDSTLLASTDNVINVHARGLNAQAPSIYNMPDVTGVDFAVQATSQKPTRR